MAKVYGRKLVNGAAARHRETQAALRKVTREVEARAKSNLAEARASTIWDKIADPARKTEIGSTRGDGKYGAIDWAVYMDAYKGGAMALEFGHAPSGVFGEGGLYGHLKTKAPHGLYILTRAAGLGGLTTVSSGRKRGKR